MVLVLNRPDDRRYHLSGGAGDPASDSESESVGGNRSWVDARVLGVLMSAIPHSSNTAVIHSRGSPTYAAAHRPFSCGPGEVNKTVELATAGSVQDGSLGKD